MDTGIATFQQVNSFTGVIRLNSPKNGNALSKCLVARLARILDHLYEAQYIKLVFLEHEGPVFCAGGDVKELALAAEDAKAQSVVFAKFLQRLSELPQMLIALLNGKAFGGGIGILSCCDMVIATKPSQVALSEVKLGMVPATISPYVISKIGVSNARRYFLTAETIDAKRALDIGLFHEVVSDDHELEQARYRMMKQLNLCAPEAVAKCKALVLNAAGRRMDDEFQAYTADLLSEVRQSEEVSAGVAALLKKTSPPWLAKL